MKSVTATEARANLFHIIGQAVQKRSEYHIRSKKGNAVLISEDDYENLIETLHLLSTPGFLKSIKKAKQEIRKNQTFSMEEIFGKDS